MPLTTALSHVHPGFKLLVVLLGLLAIRRLPGRCCGHTMAKRGNFERHRECQRRVVDCTAVHQDPGLRLCADERRQTGDLTVPGQGRRAVHGGGKAQSRVGFEGVVPLLDPGPQ